MANATTSGPTSAAASPVSGATTAVGGATTTATTTTTTRRGLDLGDIGFGEGAWISIGGERSLLPTDSPWLKCDF